MISTRLLLFGSVLLTSGWCQLKTPPDIPLNVSQDVLRRLMNFWGRTRRPNDIKEFPATLPPMLPLDQLPKLPEQALGQRMGLLPGKHGGMGEGSESDAFGAKQSGVFPLHKPGVFSEQKAGMFGDKEMGSGVASGDGELVNQIINKHKGIVQRLPAGLPFDKQRGMFPEREPGTFLGNQKLEPGMFFGQGPGLNQENGMNIEQFPDVNPGKQHGGKQSGFMPEGLDLFPKQPEYLGGGKKEPTPFKPPPVRPINQNALLPGKRTSFNFDDPSYGRVNYFGNIGNLPGLGLGGIGLSGRLPTLPSPSILHLPAISTSRRLPAVNPFMARENILRSQLGFLPGRRLNLANARDFMGMLDAFKPEPLPPKGNVGAESAGRGEEQEGSYPGAQEGHEPLPAGHKPHPGSMHDVRQMPMWLQQRRLQYDLFREINDRIFRRLIQCIRERALLKQNILRSRFQSAY